MAVSLPPAKLHPRHPRALNCKPEGPAALAANATLPALETRSPILIGGSTVRSAPHVFAHGDKGPAIHVPAEDLPSREQRAVEISVAAFEYAECIQAMGDPLGIQKMFAAQLASLGFTNFTLVEFSPDPKTIERHVIDNQMPEEWGQRYVQNRYLAYDPVIMELLANTEPFLWSEALKRHDANKRQQRIFHEASEFGLNEGVCIPIFGPCNYLAWVTLAGDRVDLSPRARMAAHMMSIYTHNRLVKLVRPKRPPHATLTEREADCLRWAAHGKTDWEIGEILSISENTTHWHIENAKRKIGVATRMQAVVGAIAEGMIRL